MNVGQLKELLVGFNDETEVKIAGWLQTPKCDNGFGYNTRTLGSENISVEKSFVNDTSSIIIGIDLM